MTDFKPGDLVAHAWRGSFPTDLSIDRELTLDKLEKGIIQPSLVLALNFDGESQMIKFLAGGIVDYGIKRYFIKVQSL